MGSCVQVEATARSSKSDWPLLSAAHHAAQTGGDRQASCSYTLTGTGPLSSVIGWSGLVHSLTEWVSRIPGGSLGVELCNEDHLSVHLKYGLLEYFSVVGKGKS